MGFKKKGHSFLKTAGGYGLFLPDSPDSNEIQIISFEPTVYLRSLMPSMEGLRTELCPSQIDMLKP